MTSSTTDRSLVRRQSLVNIFFSNDAVLCCALHLTDIMVLPGFLHLSLVQATVNPGIMIGAQNVSAHGEGAFTGEIAADHIKDY